MGWSHFISKAKKGKALWNNKDRVFEPLYNMARKADQQIGKCFMMDYFETNLERFGQTYKGLEEEEQDSIRNELYELLEHGALDMAQHDLDKFLMELTLPEDYDAGE